MMMHTSRRGTGPTQNAVKAARHICQEARVVLTSLRGGPPAVARGELAHDLVELRTLAKARLEAPDEPMPIAYKAARPCPEQEPPLEQEQSPHQFQQQINEEDDGLEGAVLVQRRDAQAFVPPESPIPTSKLCNITVQGTPKIKEVNPDGTSMRGVKLSPENVGPFAHPFLAVVMDPRAAGPHTLVALRALFRLLEMGSLVQPSGACHGFHVAFEPLMRGVLACKFEQTDAGADEAVEMAIADLLALVVNLEYRSIPPETLMDAFNTVFVTRNTFVHSPALCYHFEDVLSSMVVAIFEDLDASDEAAPRLILEFLVNQLLHTPLVGGEVLDESAQEAQMAHDATRVLCLRLVQCCLRTGWGSPQGVPEDVPKLPLGTVDETQEDHGGDQAESREDTNWEERTVLQIIQDDLCLSLLMTGQAIWAYHDASSNISPGIISLEVLSEICATLSTLWNTVILRGHLVSQFETIFTGFYQRALALLRRRRNPMDSVSFNANLVFDAEVEIILESLVDLVCLHSQDVATSEENGAVETLFSTYDCHMSRSDVASGLLVELCRCCGGSVGEDGELLSDLSSRFTSFEGTSRANTPVSGSGEVSSGVAAMMQLEPWRPVPAHLKELCVETLLGAMKSLFRDEQNLRGQGSSNSMEKTTPTSTQSLRNTKSKKRLMRQATELFNNKSTDGIRFLVSSGLVPNPVTPANVASFLRNGIVVGLDKRAAGAYLGNVGKAPVAGKSPPSWERDWFHKDVLSAYCSLFHFERQSLLEGLRMFLASFRLPGEAQQIDRILQAFAESCGRTCDESSQGRLKLFSPDPKKASDAAYLLSFSIIMLNTDQHNDNIRDDRKMKMEDFVKNNTDYGRDITEAGHELPREFLEGIYESIREEEIRTEGEGADGHMTVERWKDVLRGPVTDANGSDTEECCPEDIDAVDLKELVLEDMWRPVISTIGALWGVTNVDHMSVEGGSKTRSNTEGSHSGMLGAQGARLGMDMALGMLGGIRKLGRMDLFEKFFLVICGYSGLVCSYTTDAVDRTLSFVNSVEAQSAVIVAIQIAKDAGADIGVAGWKCVWGLIFELRDLKLLVGGSQNKKQGILFESDPDLLTDGSRREWTMRVIKGSGSATTGSRGTQKRGIFASLFGSQDNSTGHDGVSHTTSASSGVDVNLLHSVHGKEELLVWNDFAPSDDEEEPEPSVGNQEAPGMDPPPYGSAGAAFESQLIHEDILVYHQEITPITGLERVEDTRQYHISPRARVRKRLARACDFDGIVSESRFLDMDGIQCLLTTLVDMVKSIPFGSKPADASESSRELADTTSSPEGQLGVPRTVDALPISPASEALAEILICEITLKNRDRLGILWQTTLRDHYVRRLGKGEHADRVSNSPSEERALTSVSPGLEKCITGLLRIASCAVLREDIANDVIATFKVFCVTEEEPNPCSWLQRLDKHVGEGLWRICRNVEGLQYLDAGGWIGIFGLAQWCAWREAEGTPSSPGLAEDDPALQAFRSMHLILHSPEVQDVVPFTVVGTIRAVIVAGERRHCPKLSIAGLDLLQLVHVRLQRLITQAHRGDSETEENKGVPTGIERWMGFWSPLVETMAEAAEHSRHLSVREHALSLITDAFIDKHGRSIPAHELCSILQRICIPLAEKRIAGMFNLEHAASSSTEEMMTEFELCVGLLFKPFLHHLKNVIRAEVDVMLVWKPILVILENLLNFNMNAAHEDASHADRSVANRHLAVGKALSSAKELACEHLRNAVMVLLASGVLDAESNNSNVISNLTWNSLAAMKFGNDVIAEWKRSAVVSPDEEPVAVSGT